MLSYIHFLLKTFSKRISSYILVAIHLVVIYIFLRVNIDNFPTNDRGISYLSSIKILMKFFPFLFASVFSILVVTHAFSPNVNGIEIMIVAKPITRKQIIISKFLVVFSLLIIHQVFIFISYSLLSLYDSSASSTVRANWVISLALGGFIVQTIFVFIIILMASLVGKMGTAIIGILIAAIIPIFSIIITPLSQATVSLDSLSIKQPSYVKTLQINSKSDKASDDGNRVLSLNNTYTYNILNKVENMKFWNKYQKDKWYQYVYPYDIWYQWGRFYNVVTKNYFNAQKDYLTQNLKIKNYAKIKSNDIFLTTGEQGNYDFPLAKYILTVENPKEGNTKITKDNFQRLLKFYFEKRINPEFKINSIKDLVAKIKDAFKIRTGDDYDPRKEINIEEFNNQSSLEYRLSSIERLIRHFELGSSKVESNSQIDFALILTPIFYKILEEESTILKNRKVTTSSLALKRYGLIEVVKGNENKKVLGYTIISEPYASTETLIVIWLLIIISLSAISISIFLKKDFK